MFKRKIRPVHPGEILKEEFIKPLKITEYRLAKNIKMPARRVNEIIHGHRAITADTALRFFLFFGTSPQFWLNLQTQYDLEIGSGTILKKIKREVIAWQYASA